MCRYENKEKDLFATFISDMKKMYGDFENFGMDIYKECVNLGHFLDNLRFLVID